MPSPIVPTYRLAFQYTVLAYPHTRHEYIAGVTPSSDPTGYDITSHGSVGHVGMSVAADAYWTDLQAYYDASDAQFGACKLQHFVSGAWVTLSQHNTVISPSGGGTFIKGQQTTTTFFDTSFKRYRLILLESEGPVGTKAVSSSGLWLSALVNHIASPDPSIEAQAGNWVKSRSGASVRNFISQTTDLNNKIRRGRHTA